MPRLFRPDTPRCAKVNKDYAAELHVDKKESAAPEGLRFSSGSLRFNIESGLGFSIKGVNYAIPHGSLICKQSAIPSPSPVPPPVSPPSLSIQAAGSTGFRF